MAVILVITVFVAPAMTDRTETGDTITSTAPSSYGVQTANTQYYEYIGPWGPPDQNGTKAPQIGSSWTKNCDETMTLSVDVAITTGDCGDYGEGEYVNAWVDWDDSGTFDADEQVMDLLKNASKVGCSGTLHYEVTFPCENTGTHWTRVNLGYNYDPSSGTDTWECGDIEDAQISFATQVPVAQWQQKNITKPKAVALLGPGNNVNPDQNSRVRVRITNIPGKSSVISVKLYEEDYGFWNGDDFEGDLKFTQKGNEATTNWITPPIQVEDPGESSEWYAVIKIKYTSGKTIEIETPIINVPDGVVVEEVERTLSVSTIKAGGCVKGGGKIGSLMGVEGNVNMHTSRTTIHKRIVDFGATYKDPKISVELILFDSLPTDWSLSLDPSNFDISPDQSQSVDLVIYAPTPGDVRFVVKSTSYSLGGASLVDETDPLLLHVKHLDSSDSSGNKKDSFLEGDEVYAIGSGYDPNTTYNLSITNNAAWTDGWSIASAGILVTKTVTTDDSGNISVTPIWASAVIGYYDVIVDVNGDGYYNASIDALDDADVNDTGFEAIERVELPS